MKKVTVLLFLIEMLCAQSGISQTLNWARFTPAQRHILNVNAGLDNGVTYGISYAYRLPVSRPVLLNIAHSHPSGNTFFDDFKTKIGVQTRLVQWRSWQISANGQGIFRRFENSSARLVNFGCEVSATAGFYRRRWFVAADIGFDKAIVTHFKHGEAYRENFPGVQDGWYEPATGGNFFNGIQAGYSAGRSDVYLKAGSVVTQDFKTKPFIPFYAQLGWSIRL